jgi:hypothetical protein
VRWTRFARIHALVNTGHTEVVDADLSGYFDSIPHAELMKSVARRVSDRHRPMLLDTNGPCLLGHATVTEEGLAALS